jgi:serine/threonine-protein kinase HipA
VAELLQLVRAATFNVLTGNADAHGKNVALLHPAPGLVSLAPMYDTVPTALWPNLRADAAMTVNGRIQLDDVAPDDIAAEARHWRLDSGEARQVAIDTARAVVDAAALVALPHRLADMVVARGEAFLAG